MCHLRKKAIYLKKETRSMSQKAETLYKSIISATGTQQTSIQIVGTEERIVPIYVVIDSKKIILNCLTEKLLMQRIIDPKYQWTGPRGQITEESQRFVLNSDGSLEIYKIKGSDAGSYTCKANYLYKNKQLTTKIHFMLYVYHVPERSIYMTSEFTSGTCETSTVASFIKYLLEKLESLIYKLNCEIKQWNTQCHTATDTLKKITYKFTFQFIVFPLGLGTGDFCQNSHCEHSKSSIRKAYVKIKQFFEVQNTDSFPGDLLSYVPGTLSGVKIDHCKPGFGKNTSTMNNNTICPGCCVTCPPGRFSAKYGTNCILCPAGSYNGKYGQVACENCPKHQSSDGKGAVTGKKCHKILPMWMAFLISSTATSIFLGAMWMIIINCCKKTIATQYIKEAESQVKRRLQAFANIASDTEIQEQRNKLNPIKQQRNKISFLEEESIGLLSSDEITEASTDGTNLSPDQMEPGKFEINFGEKSSITLENNSNFFTNAPEHAQKCLIDIMKHKQS
ncbi:zona pellucida-binding protein 1-like [Pseudonaja textilis]|uniref:zona pellucida-binding protein 1-like n=1 Tax=Pseudonaja textilis TaxID=8673 RepID=UPI000EA953C7|nr:zona pellucida-binding protein 1-like [Pseudonaja textilis]